MSILGNLTSPTSLNPMNIQNVMLALIAIGWFHCSSTNHVFMLMMETQEFRNSELLSSLAKYFPTLQQKHSC